METLKEKIYRLRALGFSYKKIKKELKCSISTIAYHLSPSVKEKHSLARARNRKYSLRSILCYKIAHFFEIKTKSKRIIKNRYSPDIVIKVKIRNFVSNYLVDGKYMKATFTALDIINKFTTNPICYLTGESIDFFKPDTYHFDHIIPKSKGGNNSLDNLGICINEANRAKFDKTPEEFIELCKRVLTHNGYQVNKSAVLP